MRAHRDRGRDGLGGSIVSDPRLGELLGSQAASARVVLLGFPSDEGVRRNGGRPGAAAGPAAIRGALGRFTPDARDPSRFAELLRHTVDLGDLAVTGDLEGDQQRLGEAVAPHLDAGRFVIVLGGGHETAFGHFLGYHRPVSIVNWDAHADVRELKGGLGHSGSPFRQALEHPRGLCRGYTVAGLQPHSVPAEHLAYVRQHGRAIFRDELQDGDAVAAVYADLAPTLVSFDLDAVNGSEAPGVSAPATDGLTSAMWLRAAYLAGADARVTSADVVELLPAHDPDGRTARLAALTVWQLLRGIAARSRSP